MVRISIQEHAIKRATKRDLACQKHLQDKWSFPPFLHDPSSLCLGSQMSTGKQYGAPELFKIRCLRNLLLSPCRRDGRTCTTGGSGGIRPTEISFMWTFFLVTC